MSKHYSPDNTADYQENSLTRGKKGPSSEILDVT